MSFPLIHPLELTPGLSIDPPVILAPMAGVTDAPFRAAVRRFGVGLTVTEMVASREVLRTTKVQKRMASDETGAQPQAVQLLGWDPDIMADAARLCEDKGAQIIDVNMGCPAKKVVKKLAGAALMQDERLVGDILSKIVDAVSLPVTLKMRTGWTAEHRNAPHIAKIAEACGVRMLTVHGRSADQKYNGHADWQFIAKVKQATSLPVIGNGDVNSVDDAVNMLKQSGADGVMIGRGACGRPWFLAQICAFLKTGQTLSDPPMTEKRDVAIAHFEAMLSCFGTLAGIRRARKHLAWYLNDIPNAAQYRNRLFMLDNPKEIVALLTNEAFIPA